MASQNKTTETAADVAGFIHAFVDSDQKKADSFQLMELMSDWSGHPPKMWGPSIIGFGTHHYQYASGRQGDMPLIAFSPRKAAFSLYITTRGDGNEQLLDKLGKFTMGKSCIYFKKLSELDLIVLEQMCRNTIHFLQTHPGHGC